MPQIEMPFKKKILGLIKEYYLIMRRFFAILRFFFYRKYILWYEKSVWISNKKILYQKIEFLI